MKNLTPMLVKMEDGKIGVQLRLGKFSATCPLPDEMATYDRAKLETFFDSIVPTMTDNLIAMRNKEQRRLKRRASNAFSGPRHSSANSEANRKKLKENPESCHLRSVE